MKTIPLYTGRQKDRHLSEFIALVDDEDYEYLNQWTWLLFTIYHTETKIYYAVRNEINPETLKSRGILMHRVILQLTDKKDKGDHIDGNGLNNQRYNLRKSTHSQNMANRRSSKNSKSKYLGVYWCPNSKKWRSYCKKNGKVKTKYYLTESEAAMGYNRDAKEMHGEFAKFNVIV